MPDTPNAHYNFKIFPEEPVNLSHLRSAYSTGMIAEYAYFERRYGKTEGHKKFIESLINQFKTRTMDEGKVSQEHGHSLRTGEVKGSVVTSDVTLTEVINQSINLCSKADYIAHRVLAIDIALQGQELEDHEEKITPTSGDKLRLLQIKLQGIEDSLDDINTTVGRLTERLSSK